MVYVCFCANTSHPSVHRQYILSSVCSNAGLENDKKRVVKECACLKQDLRQAHLEVEALQARLAAVQNTDEKVCHFQIAC